MKLDLAYLPQWLEYDVQVCYLVLRQIRYLLSIRSLMSVSSAVHALTEKPSSTEDFFVCT
jgi:hypothetical protein